MTTLSDALTIEADAAPGRVGYAVTNLVTGQTLTRSADVAFPTASTIKLPILTAFHAFVASGGADWDDQVAIDRSLSFGGSGILQYLKVTSLSFRDVAWLMICLSDNLATNLLMNRMTIEGTNRIIRDIVGPGLVVNKWAGLQVDATVRSMGTASPAALTRYLVALSDDDLPGSAATLAIGREQQHRESTLRYLPADDGTGTGFIASSKGGSLPGIRTGIAILRRGGARAAVTFMIADADESDPGTEDALEMCIGRMTRHVYDAWLVDPA